MCRREGVLGRGAGGLLREVGREALVIELDGNVDCAAQRRRRSVSVSAACSPRAPRSVSGRPTTTRSTSSSRTSRASSASPLSVEARSTTPSGRASVPVGSETATPVRAEP